MARPHRNTVMPSDKVGHYHIYNRCVRGAFLLTGGGSDDSSQDPRKDWIQSYLQHLCGAFAIEVSDFSIMDNHFHLMLRNRPDLVSRYSDLEAARRWWHLHPLQTDERGGPATPQPFQLEIWLNDKRQINSIRRRLSDISCFMQMFSETIAGRANREDGEKGRFFQERFKATRLLDETSILACSVYVNLNPIRARQAESPERSRYTSIFERIKALTSWQQQTQYAFHLGLTEDQERAIEASLFICPLRRASQLESVTAPPYNPFPAPRASERGYLPLGLAEYLKLIDWTGRQLRHDKRGSIPSDLAPVLQRLGSDESAWIELVANQPRLLRSAAGKPDCLQAEAERTGRRWIRGVDIAREFFD